MGTRKVIQKSKYRGVSKYKILHTGKVKEAWLASIKRDDVSWEVYKDTEREAALAYDMKMIEMGHEPRNILKRK